MPGSCESGSQAKVTSDSSVLALTGGALGEQSRGCPAGPTFPEGAGEPSSCPGFALSPWDSQPTGLTTLPAPHTLPTPPHCTPGHRPCPGPSRTPQLRHQAHLWGECSARSSATKASVCVGVLCFYKLSSLVVIRLKQFSPSVNASLQNHWRYIIRQPICSFYFLGATRKS